VRCCEQLHTLNKQCNTEPSNVGSGNTDNCRHAIRQVQTNTTPNRISTFHIISEQHEVSEPDFETNEFLHIK